MTTERKQMFMDGTYSVVGRTTGNELVSLRNMLDIGTDPAFDYSKRIQVAKDAAKSSVSEIRKKPPPQDGDQESTGMVGPLAELQKALGLGLQEKQEQDDAMMGSTRKPIIEIGQDVPGHVAKARAQSKLKPTYAFVNLSYREMAEHEEKRKDVFPTSAAYRVKEGLAQPRLLIPDMSVKPKHIGLKTKAALEEVEKLKAEGKLHEANNVMKHSISLDYLNEAPMPVGPKIVTHDMGKPMGHAPPETMVNIVFNINSFDTGIQDAINNTFERRPVRDFDQTLGHASPEGKSYFQPGQYKCRFNAVRRRDDKAGVAWSAGGVGRPFRKKGLESFVPDRSLCRSCPFIEPRLLIPDMSKQTSRPNPSEQNVRTSEKSFKPEYKEEVYRNQMEYDAGKAQRFTEHKTAVSNFRKSLRREQSIVGTRAYGSDRALQKALHLQDIISVETLPLERIDSPLVVPRIGIGIEKFERNRGRSVGPALKKESELPPRFQEQVKQAQCFMREFKRGESRCEVSMLSPLSHQVVNLRRSRLYSPVRGEDPQ